jgi:hypothetical protein
VKKYFNPLKPDSARVVYELLPMQYADPDVAPNPIAMQMEVRDKDSVLVYGPRALSYQDQKSQVLWWNGKDNQGDTVNFESGPFIVHLKLRYSQVARGSGEIERTILVNSAFLVLITLGSNEGSFTSLKDENNVICDATIVPVSLSSYLDQLQWKVDDLLNDEVISGNPDDPPPGRLTVFQVPSTPPKLPSATDGRKGTLKYLVTVTLTIDNNNISAVDTAFQDSLDGLRQEYIDVEKNGMRAPRVPERIEFDQEEPIYENLLSAYESRHLWRMLHELNNFVLSIEEAYQGNLQISSGYRCPSGNKSLQLSVANSNHIYGRAFDYDQGGTSEDKGLNNWRVLQSNNATADSYLWLIHAVGDPEHISKANAIPPGDLPEGDYYDWGHCAH